MSIAAMAQSTGRISGRISDAQTREPLAGATVALRNGNANAVTDNQGKFVLNNVKPGRYTVVMSFVGYGDATQIVQVTAGGDANVDMELSISTRTEEEVVVTASRRAEKITRAPAAISVINARDLEQSASFLPGELASKLQGVEFVRTGVNGVGINARGFNNAFNAKILQMTDGRNSMMAGGSGLPSGIMNTVIKEDIERLEIVLGPNSALYGPNAHNGIANTITKDPRKYQGTTMAITAGIKLRASTPPEKISNFMTAYMQVAVFMALQLPSPKEFHLTSSGICVVRLMPIIVLLLKVTLLFLTAAVRIIFSA
jgi:iron complex outermembrane receptor protein